ncbi:Sua5/YciO/YrdC/YwlC family protein [candidate division WOR-3 bacterium]|nr:Sua5/YciO/YrdC/YwlC family protein [candidate division WOR-3 bacterium]
MSDEPVLIPTDTVWGIAFWAESKIAYEKTMTIKERPFEKKIPLLSYSIESAYRLFEKFDPKLYGLTQKYWPGPLTVVGKASKKIPEHLLDDKGKVAVRVPRKPAPINLIKALDFIGATSANVSGEKTPSALLEISKMFPKLDILELDVKRKIAKKQPSTVIETQKNKIIIWRKGEISPFVISSFTGMDVRYESDEPLSILFVCEGNTCRSPIAEALFRKKAGKLKIPVEVQSAGVKISKDSSDYSDKAKRALKEMHGIDLEGKPKKLSKAYAERADLILVMDAKIYNKAKKIGGEDKIKLLSEYSGEKKAVSDPWNKEYEYYCGTTDEIQRHIDNLYKYLSERIFPLTQNSKNEETEKEKRQ